MKGRHVAIAALALASAGWDTTGHYDEGDPPQWSSIYEGNDEASAAQLVSNGNVDTSYLTGNEHADLAHVALLQLGWRDMLYAPDLMPTLLDLNASVWHTEARSAQVLGGRMDGDDPSTPLFERTFPHPARWAGVADFSFTAYDWLNRNSLCPALPATAPSSGLCHEYTAWLGAGLNSSHFGEQPVRMYRRLHGTAMALARNAGAMRAALAANPDADSIPIEEMIKEAELWALAYEGYAQHFLHDRWSSGHMWSRYGSPEYKGQDLLQAMAVGGFSGLIHGAEAVLKGIPTPQTWVPDALCSPVMLDLPTTDQAYPVQFSGGGFSGVAAIGDYRLEDAFDGRFGAEYGYDNVPINVTTQMESMMQCSRAGWADVARQFGPNPDGSMGVLALPVDGAATFDAAVAVATENGDPISCFEMWVDNNAMTYAVNDPTKFSMWSALTTAAAGAFGVEARALGAYFKLDLPDVGKAFFEIQAHGVLNPSGFDLADGRALPPIMGVSSGAAYVSEVPASYIEPNAGGDDPFAGLPIHSDRWDEPFAGARPGRDLHTLHGVMNGAHARHWCETGEDVLSYNAALELIEPRQGLRWPVPMPSGGGNQPSAEEADVLARRLDACTLIADRLFEGTHAWYRNAEYDGPQREDRRIGHNGTGAAVAPSTCDALGARPPTWSDGPIELHPGYVADDAPYATESFYGDTVYDSIRNWCMAVPVVHVDDDDIAVDAAGDAIVVHPGLDDNGLVSFAPAVQDPEVTLYGANFGDVAGQVQLDSERGCVTDPPISHFADVIAWSDTQITIRIPHTRFIPDLYQITILRADRKPGGTRVRSVGRARLDVRIGVFSDVGDTSGPLPTDITGQLFAAVHPFCAGSVVVTHAVHDCTGVDESQCGTLGGPGTLMWENGAPAGYQPGPFAEHQWGVVQTGVCLSLPSWVQCIAQYPAAGGTYGMVYRIERTSTAPVTATPKRWRWTLVWARPDV